MESPVERWALHNAAQSIVRQRAFPYRRGRCADSIVLNLREVSRRLSDTGDSPFRVQPLCLLSKMAADLLGNSVRKWALVTPGKYNCGEDVGVPLVRSECASNCPDEFFSR